jgi:mycothiol synthase
VVTHVNGLDDGARAFATRFGFQEVDRQVEQVRALHEEPAPVFPEGVEVVTVAERPDLLRDAFDLGVQGYADMATPWPATITLDEWLGQEATYPEGSFVALAGGEIVGYSGLMRDADDPTRAEDGLTVVRRDWRRRGLAIALKRAELTWAAANGIREIYTWTQRGNEGMRAVNERLGYVYRHVELTMRAPLPLP